MPSVAPNGPFKDLRSSRCAHGLFADGIPVSGEYDRSRLGEQVNYAAPSTPSDVVAEVYQSASDLR
ncbi:hypothetical protein PUNSTDRAFT_56055 [Punctularia strigosozonata HHB-11173 SS5]|uniref:Uncharacterized protein n=1 Tax=Punctularia strigosozonata (strain HHB-11173) TaxID=741275 RepID=R7S193_PUNST|nr:uncharacterized protein PUNSTDRAFT_56055 [Punctularia strigosozonata HHB-11173 SS5]EIN03614.1 hypothetical protein PUNSTDRAFT_56055 [Punctularia strigosozonata HHB-11173 SS5]